MSYIITNTRGQIVATVLTGDINTTATDVTLIGQNVFEYGLYQNDNIVRVLENFANVAPPAAPLQGQLWFDTANSVLSYRNMGNTWSNLASQDYVQAQKVSPAFTGIPTAPTAAANTATTQLATTAFVTSALTNIDLTQYALLSGATFTGNLNAATASVGTQTTQVATTAFARTLFDDTTISKYVTKIDGEMTGDARAPTLANIAANSNAIATTAWVQNLYADTGYSPYATKANAVLTGVPTAPTAANNVANTQIATTAYVHNFVNDLDLTIYATKANPVFSGNVVAPTVVANTNSNIVATTAFVQAQKANIVLTGVPLAPTAANGTNSTQLATTEFVTAAISALNISSASEQAGSIKMWGSSTPPMGWALCNGLAVSRATYPTLFTRIGTIWGPGDGSTTFNLPDFRDRFAVGASDTVAPGATGGFADAAVITHTHPVSSSVAINDSGHNHNNVLQGTSDNQQRRVTLNRAIGASGTDATGSNLGRNTDNATTGISATVNVSISAPNGAVSGTGRNLPPFLAGWWIIKLNDDGSGGGTLQAGSGIDVTTGNGYSIITNTGIKSLSAGSGIGLSGSAGNLTITNTGSLPTLVAGQGISIAQSNTTFTITNTVTAPPVVAGPGIQVTNTAGGAIVNANVANLQGGTGITLDNNNGTWTINAPGSGSASLGASGWQELPSGLIMQWGTDTATGYLHTVTFPRPFPNAAFSVTVSGVANSTTFFIPFNTNLTTTGYQQGFYNNTGGGGAASAWTGRYIALGY
jgi:microcystin-dependent protein